MCVWDAFGVGARQGNQHHKYPKAQRSTRLLLGATSQRIIPWLGVDDDSPATVSGVGEKHHGANGNMRAARDVLVISDMTAGQR